MSDLFEASGVHPPDAPLADRQRPRTLEEVVGLDHLLGQIGDDQRPRERQRRTELSPPGTFAQMSAVDRGFPGRRR